MSERYYKAMGIMLTIVSIARWVGIIAAFALLIYVVA